MKRNRIKDISGVIRSMGAVGKTIREGVSPVPYLTPDPSTATIFVHPLTMLGTQA